MKILFYFEGFFYEIQFPPVVTVNCCKVTFRKKKPEPFKAGRAELIILVKSRCKESKHSAYIIRQSLVSSTEGNLGSVMTDALYLEL